MLLGVLTFNADFAREVAIYPLVIGGVAIIASIIGALAVRTRSDRVEGALYRGLIVSGVLSAAAFYPITKWLMDDPLKLGTSIRTAALFGTSPTDLWLCALIGIAVTAGLFVITDFYTSTRFRPVRTIAQASVTGHATNIIQGLAQGFQSTAAPALVIALAILGANELAGIYGIGVAVMAQLSLTGLIVALDAFGPITDNAGGIAEMADLPEEVRNVTDPLDAVGNTTKAVTKGYAIGSAALAALVLFAAFKEELAGEAPNGFDLDRLFNLTTPGVLIGLLIGGMMVYLFAALAIEAVGRAGGQVVEEVRTPVPRAPGDHGGHRAARVRAHGGDRHRGRAARDDPAVADPDRGPGGRRADQRRRARRPADRSDRGRAVHGDLDDRRRRRLGQRQEADRGRRVRRQGLRGPRRRGHRRHRRRPLQGHRRPGDQPDDQGRQHRRAADHPDRSLLVGQTGRLSGMPLASGHEIGSRRHRVAAMSEPINVADYERLAAEVLEPGPHGYFAGGAGDERTLRDNVAAFWRAGSCGRGRWSTSSAPSAATTLLGAEVSTPIMVAPVALQRLAHADGEQAMARAAAAAGAVLCLSTLATARPREVARGGAAVGGAGSSSTASATAG